MGVSKPGKRLSKRELIESALRDLDPSIREQARRILEELDESSLSNRERVRDHLRKYKLI